VQKWSISKAVSSTSIRVIRILTVNYDTPRQYIFFLVRRCVTFKLTVFRLWQTNFASYEESTGSPVWDSPIWDCVPYEAYVYLVS